MDAKVNKVRKTVLVLVLGGNVQSVYTDAPEDIVVEIFDADNLEAEGKSTPEISRLLAVKRKGLTTIY